MENVVSAEGLFSASGQEGDFILQTASGLLSLPRGRLSQQESETRESLNFRRDLQFHLEQEPQKCGGRRWLPG